MKKILLLIKLVVVVGFAPVVAQTPAAAKNQPASKSNKAATAKIQTKKTRLSAESIKSKRAEEAIQQKPVNATAIIDTRFN